MSRRHRSGLLRRLEVTMVGVALISVLLLSGINYVFARVLVSESVEAQLTALADTRVQALERGAIRLQADAATLAVSPSVVDGLEALAAGYAELERVELTPEQSAQLDGAYDIAVEELVDTGGFDLPTGAVMPTSNAGRALQYNYILENPFDFGERAELDDAGDGSDYSAAHAEYHPVLRALARNSGWSDLLLVDAATREVVYSVDKHIDIGTNVTTGPWAQNGLGDVIDRLTSTTVGEAVVGEMTFYVPARGEATIFLATAVRSGSEVTGAIITMLPVDLLTDLITGSQDWESLGLGKTGDVYLVGPDQTLRTEPRTWLDDPEAFLTTALARSGDEPIIEQMRLVGSPALRQVVDNAAIEAALNGDQFVGRVGSFDGDRTFAASGPVVLGNETWAVVVEQDRSEANEGLWTLLRSVLLVMVVLLPITALLGVWLARSLTRPFRQLVDAARCIARGESAPTVSTLGKNELGDVGRQLERVAARLDEEADRIAAEESQINEILGAVLPLRLVDRVRCGEETIADLVDTASAMSFLVHGVPEATGSNQDTVFELLEHLVAEVDRLAEEFEVQRVRLSTSNALFVAGLGQPGACVDDAVRFTVAIIDMVVSAGREYGQELTVRAGVATGDVASGVIGQQQLAFSVWGEPVSTAFSLASLAQPGEILIDTEVHDVMADETVEVWEMVRREDLPGLDENVEAWSISRRTPAAS